MVGWGEEGEIFDVLLSQREMAEKGETEERRSPGPGAAGVGDRSLEAGTWGEGVVTGSGGGRSK